MAAARAQQAALREAVQLQSALDEAVQMRDGPALGELMARCKGAQVQTPELLQAVGRAVELLTEMKNAQEVARAEAEDRTGAASSEQLMVSAAELDAMVGAAPAAQRRVRDYLAQLNVDRFL